MDVSHSWSAHEWVNRGSKLLDTNPGLQGFTGTGLAMTPSEAIAWFNLGIGLHQQVALRRQFALSQCLAPPQDRSSTGSTNNLAQDLLLLGCWQGWKHYAQRLSVNRETIRSLNAPWTQPPRSCRSNRPVLLMSEQGFGDTLQFSRYALYLQRKGFDVTLLASQHSTPAAR